MNTDSDTTRALEPQQHNTLLLAVVVLTIAFASGCSMSLVDKTPEVLRYCRIAERSEPSGQHDAAGQSRAVPSNGDNATCATSGGDDCDDDAADRLARGQQVNCGL
jgi:hypothetical protein